MKLELKFFNLKRKECEQGALKMVGTKTFYSFLFLLFYMLPAFLNGQTVHLRGLINDGEGNSLAYANVLVLPDSTIVPSDLEGKFSLKVSPGKKTIRITYTGYKRFISSFVLQKDTTVTFSLSPAIGQLEEVPIIAKRNAQQGQLRSARSGTISLSRKDISAIPALGGEADVIKTMQLLPGTIKGMEGSSDLFVRGGAADQNLVLFDGAPIYNTSHLFGFLSVFNPDVLEKVEAITGGFPAEYGGRLSSVLNITSRNEIAQKTQVSGNIGLIASRVFVAQPIIKDKLSIWVGGRRTYIDQVVKLIDEKLPYYFYDLNGKVIFKPNGRDEIAFSYYDGEDILDLSQGKDEEGFGFTSSYVSGNKSQVFQWLHRTPESWEVDVSLFHTAFHYDIKNIFEEDELSAFSSIEDYGAKVIFQKNSGSLGAGIKSGIEWTRHAVSPNVVNSKGFFSEFLESSLNKGIVAHEMAAFYQQEWQLGNKWLVNGGMRGSLGLVQNKKYFTPEPRLSLRYGIAGDQAIKISYSRMAQYVHRISNAALSTPTDIWYTVTDSVQPQRAHQLAFAWQKTVGKPEVFFSAEAYYKDMSKLIGFEEGTNLFFNSDFESQLIQGKGRAYGLELLMRKETGKLTGWLSYSLAWSWRQFNGINRDAWFPSRYDRRHNGALVMQYALSSRWSVSMVWEYISGSRFTPVVGQYVVPSPTFSGVELIPLYSDINAVKLANSHRLDLGLKFRSRPDRKFSWKVFAGVNNVYNRATPIGIFVEQDPASGSLRYTQPGLFGLLPFFNFGFDF